MSRVAILVPVLGRPHRVEPLLNSIAVATPWAHTVVFLCDSHDTEEIAAVSTEASVRPTVRLLLVDGNYARKINAGVRATSEPLVFTGADDLHFHPGWLERAVAQMSDIIGVVGTNDLCSRRVITGEHSTHSLVARWYCELGTIDEPGKLLHEAYPHEFCDDELVATAKHRGAYAHACDAVVEHLHPDVRKAPVDALYAARPDRMRVGRRIFRKRQQLWA